MHSNDRPPAEPTSCGRQLLGKVVRELRRKHFRRVLALVTALTVAIGLTVPAAYAASRDLKILNMTKELLKL